MRVGLVAALANLMLAQSAPPTIGQAEIERAKVLLVEAKGQLQPQQYQLLEQDLVEAEVAFQRYSSLAKAGGESAEVVRGVEALVAVQRASQVTEGLTTVAGAGSLLVALAALWPASTASQSQERPPKFVARIELEASLRRVAAHGQQVAEQLKVAALKKPVEPMKEAGGRDRCGSCVCFYRGFGPEATSQKATRADCKKYCQSDENGHRPANGMRCTGDKAVEWWN
jgi:hypothetical protein